jgi:hypothetical protein
MRKRLTKSLFAFLIAAFATKASACLVAVYIYCVDDNTGEFIGGYYSIESVDDPTICGDSSGGTGSTGGTNGGNTGGGGTPPPDPPYLSLIAISDANPGQPMLQLLENSSVVETTLAYDGNVISTTGNTDVLILQPLSALGTNTTVTVQARNSAYVYAACVFHITRTLQGPYAGTTNVWAVWTKPSVDGQEPQQIQSEWIRTVHMSATQTEYDISTFDARNGEWEHNQVEDQIAGVSAATPNPAWDTVYSITNPQLLNNYAGWQCSIWPIAPAPWLYGTICTDVDAFTTAGIPTGTATITDLNVTLGTWLAAGQTVTVSPQP